MKNILRTLGFAAACAGLMTGAAHAATTTTETTTTVFRDYDRTFLNDWVIFNNQGCPPGSMMVKTRHLIGGSDHRCTVPQGKTVTYYAPGAVLPTTTTYSELPDFIVQELPPAPAGDMYVSADNNVYLINPQTRTVIDAVRVVGPAD